MSLVNIYANDDNRSLEIKNKVINELQKIILKYQSIFLIKQF